MSLPVGVVARPVQTSLPVAANDDGRVYDVRYVVVSPDKVAKDPSVLCEYADVLAMQQGGRLAGRPLQLVTRALELNGRHPIALEMAGSAAYEEGRYADSARYWSDLLGQLMPGSQRHRELTEAIGRARQRQAALSGH